DELTGLPNRAMLGHWLQARTGAQCQPGQRIGLCSLDLDGFRQINALLGFGAGDRFLAAVATRLRMVLEPGGHLLARTGGDEFAVLVHYGPAGVAAPESGYGDTAPAGTVGVGVGLGTAVATGIGAGVGEIVAASLRPVVARVAERVLAA